MAELLHALIIEDSESDAELLRLQLERDGYTLMSQRVDTLEGVKTAIKKPGWEIIISDYNLPGFDASASLALFKETGEDIPFIIVSGKIEEETAVELMRNGAADFIMKDKLARLAPAVRRELRDAQIRRERRDTEIALVESNRRFQTLFEQSPFGVILFDIATTLPVEFNTIAHRQLGYTREEFAQLKISDYELIENDRAIKLRIAAVLQSGSDSFETRHRTKQGEVRNIHVTAKSIFLSDGVLLHCVFQDITSAKKAERDLDESQSAFADIFESVNEGIAYTNLSGEVLAVNQRLLDLIEVPCSELISRNVLTIAQKILSAKDVVSVLPKLMSMIKGKQVESFEVEYQGKVLEISSIYNQKSKHITGVIRDITERKRAETILRENEARFRMMYESTPVSYQSLDKEGKFLDVNPAWLKLLGFTREEVIGKWFGDFLIPEQQFLFMERFPCFVSEGEVRNVEFDMVHKDGHIVKVSFDGLIGHTAEGKFRQTHCVMKDITESKRAAEAIKTHLSLLNSMVSNISDVIAIMRADGKMTYKSPNIEKWFGWKPEDLIGTNGWDTVHPEDIERVQVAFASLLEADGKTDSIEYRYKCKDGSFRLIKLTATNLVNDPVINGVLMNYHDITERRKMENESAAISEKFRKAFVTSPDSININRLSDGLYFEVNDGFLEMTGYSKEEVMGKTSLETNIWVNPEDRARLVDGLRADGKVTNLEAPFRAKDGSIRTCLMSANIIDVDGETCILSITRDITDHKKAEEAIRLQSTALNTAANAIVITDAEDRITWVNPAFSDLSGYSLDESIGNRVYDLVRSNAHDAEFYQAIDRIVKSGKVWHGEIINRRKDGQHYVEEVTVSPLLSPDGTITNFVSVRQNISEQKKANDAIRLQSTALHAAANAISITDADNNITWVNHAFTNMTGYTWQECMGRKLEDLIRSGAHPCEFYVDIAETISSGRVWRGEIINRRKNGELFPEEMTVTPVFGEDGRIISYISIKQDITDRKKVSEVMAARLHLLEYANDHTLEDVLQETLAEAQKFTNSLIGFYHFLNDNEQTISLQAWSKPTLGSCAVDIQDTHYPIDEAGVWVDCVRQRKAVIHNDYASLPHRKGMPAGHAPVIRELVVPVFRGEKIVAVLGVGNKQSDYTEADIEQITRLADLAWDIAEKKISEQARQESEARYHDLFENSGVPTWLEDFSAVKSVFDEIRANGVTDMRTYFEQHPEEVRRCASLIKVVDVNLATVQYYGVSSKEEVLTNIPRTFNENSWPVFTEELITLAEGAMQFIGDLPVLNLKQEERIFSIHLSIDPLNHQDLKRVLVTFFDITDRIRAEEHTRAESELLQICNNAGSGKELLHNLLGFFKEFSGCEAVGIRLHENGDFPYFETKGFPESFVKMENSLCAFDADGRILRDEVGNPVLECMCGNVLRGRFDPSKPFFTQKGSFWSANTTQLLAGTSESDRPLLTRARCIDEGYESVALIPIRAMDRAFGLFQFNDSQVGLHTLEKIELLENMVNYVAIALAKQEIDSALAESEQNFREIFNSTTEAIFIDDADTGRMIDVNETMLKMYGFENKTEVLAGNIGDLSAEQPAYSEENAQERIRRAIEEGPQTFEWLAKRRDGSTFWSEVSLKKSEIGGKNRVLAVVRDITERKTIENALRKSEALLNETQQISKIGGWEWDIAAQRMTWSDGVYRIHEISPSDIPNNSPQLDQISQSCYHPDDRKKIDLLFEECLKTGKNYEVEARLIAKNGTHKWVSTSGVGHLENGEVVRVSGNIMDITDRKQAEAALHESEARVRNKLKAILEPEGDIHELELADVIDVDMMQSLMDDFYELTHVGIGVIDMQGRVLVAEGWQDICSMYHRRQPEALANCLESDLVLTREVEQGTLKQYKCKNNMWDIATPIILDGKHLGNIFLGQFLFEDEVIDEEFFREQARKFGFNEEEYLSALKSVPRWNQAKVETVLRFYTKLANMISTLSHANIKLSRTLAEKDRYMDLIRESEERYQTLITASPTAIFVMRNGRYDFANPAGLELLGYQSLQEFAGTDLISTIHPDSLPLINQRIADAAEGKTNQAVEMKVVRRNGEIVATESLFTPVQLNGESATLILSQDITARKQAEAALRKSEALLNEAQRLSKNGAWEWDIESQTMTWSDEVYRIHGFRKEDFPPGSEEPINRSLACYDPADKSILTQAFQDCTAFGKPYDLELRFTSQDGTAKWVRTMGNPVFEDGVVKQVMGNIMDITTIRQAQEAIRYSEKLLAESQSIAHLGSYLLDYENNSHFWSKETYRIFGLDENQPSPDDEAYKAMIHEEDREEFNRKIQITLLTGARYDNVYRIFRPSGAMRYVHSIGNPETNANGEVIRLVGTIQDVTESKTLELALQHSLDEQEVLLREVHHRVKNNLASILGLLEMERQTTTDPNADTLLMELGNRIKSMSTIHEKLYRSHSLSKIDFDDYLKSFVSHLRTSMQKGREIHTFVKAQGVELSLDTAVPCGLIVNELVTNALKYAFPEGKPGVPDAEQCEISVTMSARGTAYTLTVSDNGVGLPPDLDWQNAKSLGLRLILMLSEHQLGGKVTLDRHSGTRFTVKFNPVHREPSHE
jgi:PAS domain S-box-containing protein